MGTIEKCCCSSNISNDKINEVTSHKEIYGTKRIKIDEYKEKMLNLHNELRNKYLVSELERDPELDEIADEYVIKIYIKYNNYIYHLNKHIYSTEEIIYNKEYTYKKEYLGENVSISSFNSPEEIFNTWAVESDYYSFKS